MLVIIAYKIIFVHVHFLFNVKSFHNPTVVMKVKILFKIIIHSK